MNFKYTINPDVSTQLPTWVILELWEILNELTTRKTTEYTKEDLAELRSILDRKIDAIQNATAYQRELFGKSKYDL